MKFAVIETGGKQYTVKEGDIISIEKLEGISEGDNVDFSNVLLVAEGEDVTIGAPYIEGKKVSGVLKESGKGKKIRVTRFKAKSRHRRTYGHRQPFMSVEIKTI